MNDTKILKKSLTNHSNRINNAIIELLQFSRVETSIPAKHHSDKFRRL